MANHWAAVSAAIDKFASQSQDINAKDISQKVARYDKAVTSITKTTTESIKTTTQSTAVALTDFAKKVDTFIEGVSKRASERLGGVFAFMKKGFGGIDFGKFFKGKGGGAPSGKGKDPLDELMGGKVVDNLVGKLGKVADGLTALIPQLAVLASVGAFINAIVQEIFGLEEATMDYLKALGGAKPIVHAFTDRMINMRSQTRLSTAELIDLSKAFMSAGMPMSSLKGDIDAFLIPASKMVRMFGMSNEASAKYTRSLYESGMSFQQIEGNLDGVYRQMQSINGTIADANESLLESQYAWEQYGGTLGKSIDEFQKGILESKGFFKAFNMEAKDTQRVLDGIFSDVDKRRKLSSNIAAVLGMSGAKAYNQMAIGGQGALELQARGGLRTLANMLGPHAGILGMNEAQFQQYAPDERTQAAIRDRRAYAMRQLASMGYDPQMMGGLVNNFQGFMNKNGSRFGGNINSAIDAFINEKQNAQKAGADVKSMAEGIKGLNETATEFTKELGNKIHDQISKIAQFLTKDLPNLISQTQTVIDNVSSAVKLMGDALGKGVGMLTGLVKTIADKLGILNPIEQAKEWGANAFHDMFGRHWDVLTGKTPPPADYVAKGGKGGASPIFNPGNMIPKDFLDQVTGGATGTQKYGNSGRDPKFVQAVKAMAGRLGWNPDHLMAVMNFESGLNPGSVNKKSGATGLIQFMPDTAKGLGTSTKALGNMTALQQLPFVEKYFTSRGLTNIKSIDDAYLSVFSPAFRPSAVGENHPMYSRDAKSKWNRLAYMQNAGLDANHDGVITNTEAATPARLMLKQHASIADDHGDKLDKQTELLSKIEENQRKERAAREKMLEAQRRTLLSQNSDAKTMQAYMHGAIA